MYCRKCGNKIDEDSKFCSYCGEQVSKAVTFLINKQTEKKSENTSRASETTNNAHADISKAIEGEKRSNIILKFTEVMLWLGVVLVLLNLFYEEIDWWAIISNEVILFLGIAYIREWFKNFEVPLVLMILGLLSNLVVFSIIDIFLYAVGTYGVFLKRKEYEFYQ